MGELRFRSLAWLLPSALTLHNLEEWVLTPGWSAGGWEPPVGASAFRFALVVVTLAAWGITALGRNGAPHSASVHAVVACAGIVFLNVFFPHLLATVALRTYAPGVVTAVLINLWVSPLVVRAALREELVTVRGCALATAVGCGVAALLLPALFWLGGRLG